MSNFREDSRKRCVYLVPDMHTSSTPMTENCAELSPVSNASGLVTQAMKLRSCIGDGLNDFEFTEFIKSKLGQSQDGFGILSFSEGCLTVSVPAQKPADWYGEKCAIARTKEDAARAIAERHQLTLCEPPDKLVYGALGPGAHRHLEFANRWNTVAVAHPLYVKLRVCGGEHHNVPVDSEAAVAQCAELFRDLALLYRPA